MTTRDERERVGEGHAGKKVNATTHTYFANHAHGVWLSEFSDSKLCRLPNSGDAANRTTCATPPHDNSLRQHEGSGVIDCN